MFKEKWLDLQLFAGEGAGDGGGEGATTGENANNGDADQKLRELGVPQAVLDKRAKRNAGRQPKGAVTTAATQAPAEQQTEEQAAAAEDPTEEKKTDAPSRMSWEEIKADPEYKQEYDRETQNIVKQRLRTAKAAEEAMGKLTPSLEALALQLGQDPANLDYDAIAQAIDDANSYYEDKALEDGTSVETARKRVRMDLDTKRQQRTLEQQKVDNRFNQIYQQGEEMKKVFPNFDLMTEMKNPVFARMMAPDMPFTVEQAYYAVHQKELQTAAMQVTAQKVAQKISNDIQSGNRRPNENGTSGQAPSVTTFDYRNASREQREALKKRIRSGEKIYPGQV